MAKVGVLLTEILMLHVCLGYQIRGCETYVDVRENTETSIVCDGIGATHRMYWSIYSTNFDEQTIGDCTNTLDCTNNLPDYEVSRSTNTSSELKIKANFREKANKQIKCSRWNNQSSDSCTLRIVYPASPKLLLFNTDGATWTVEASCQVPKVFSSDNTYVCILNRTGPDQENVFTVRADLLSWTELADISPTYYSGRCSWNGSLPSVSAEYTYYISILPGKPNTAYRVGTAVIDPPADPEIRCSRYAIENTSHTCQCRTSTSRPGNPTPQVTWNQNPGSNELKLVNVQRGDDGNVYTCQLTWGPKNSLTVKTASYTLHVAYGPSRATISYSTNLITNGLEKFNISCTAYDVNPGANFEWDGIICVNKRADGNNGVCTFVPKAEDDGTEVKCTATNNETSSFSTVVSEVIRLRYPPSTQPTITGLVEGQPLLEGTSVLMTCIVQGGNPPVTSVNFWCGNHVDTADTVYEADVIGQSYVSSNISIDSVTTAENGTVCTCSAVWTPRPDFYRSSSTATILIIEATSAQVSQLTINNKVDDIIVNAGDNGSVILSCAASGRPTPSIRVVRVDTGQPLEVDTSHTSGQDENVQQYTLTTSARCQDAAIYRCEANNSKGTDQQTVKLYVNCTPRLVGDSQTLGLPTNPLVVSNQESSMDLIAFPVPSTRSIVFLGTATPTVDSFQGSGDSSTALGVQCQPDVETIYISRCTVRVSSDSAANGFYRVTLGSQVGSAAFLIHLNLPKQEASSSVPVPAIAGGVGGAVVIIVIMIIVVVIVSRRKRELNKRKETTTKADDEEFEEHINPVYDMEDTPEDDLKDKPKPTAVAWRVSPQNHLMNDLEDGTPVEDDRDAGYSSLSLERNQQPTIFSSPDDDTYSSVDDDSRNIQAATNNRQQFNDQDAGDYAVVGAEGEERSTEVPRGDVYAVVDKTKKQQQPSDSTTPSLSAESSGNSGQTGDVYALIDKTKKRRQTSDNTSLSPATSAQSANTGIAGPNGDVYAQVNKSLRGKAGTDTSQQKPTVKPKLARKPKPALKPKPSVSTVGDVTKDGNSVSGLGAGVEYDPYEDIEISSPESPSLVTDAQNMTTMQTTETDDEYNTLRFDNNYPARETAAGDTEYSHLGSV